MRGATGYRQSIADWRLLAAAGLWSATGLIALILASRAVMGAFDSPVSAFFPGLMAALMVAANLCACSLCREWRGPRSSWGMARRLGFGLASLISPAIAGAATAVNASPFGLGVVAGVLVIGLTVVIVSEGIQRSESLESSDRDLIRQSTDGFHGEILNVQEGDDPISVPWEVPGPTAGHQTDSEMVQQIARHKHAGGTEQMEAMLMAVFAPHCREISLHLPIHPALGGTPRVECEPLDDSPVSIEVTAAHPYGIRVEVKRDSRLEEPLRVPIGLEISTTGSAVNVA